MNINLAGVSQAGPQARVIVLSGENVQDVNRIGKPAKIAPVESEVNIAGAAFTQSFQPRSLTVLHVKAQ